MVGIVLLAMVAAFLALRLYAVLGKRTGHEQTFVAPVEPPAPAVAVSQSEEPRTLPTATADALFEPDAASGIRAIVAADPGFDAARFVEGAKSAYRMILEAFWRGDETALAELVDDHVGAEFGAAIAARKESGEVLDNRLVLIEKALISDAALDGKVARLTVRFDADIAAITRDADGKVIAGSMDDAVTTHDAWTFTRTVKSADPNWILTDTDESA
ncbi:MAG: Tim44 domain-containing protein [Sphingomonadaceae bacterium]|nr:Tim44 domain-containing protein [Sphingomonadaceae bacterium]